MLRIDCWDEDEWDLRENLERVRRRSQPRTQQPDHRFDPPPGAAIDMICCSESNVSSRSIPSVESPAGTLTDWMPAPVMTRILIRTGEPADWTWSPSHPPA